LHFSEHHIGSPGLHDVASTKFAMTVDPKDIAALGAKLDAWISLETALREDLVGIHDLLDGAPDNQSLRRASSVLCGVSWRAVSTV
jgi:hypothetical protein